jgi:sugar lactone lactonase YvrE/plastocyanin
MKLSALLYRRFRWINLPGAILLVLLQRTPLPGLLATAEEMFAAAPAGVVLKSAVAAVATLGAVNTLVGATPLVPSSGTASGLTVTAGNAVDVFYSVNGTQTPPQSWTIGGNIPPGLDFSGLTSPGTVNTTTLHLSGTPTSGGTYGVTIMAWQFSDAGGIGSPTYNYTITVNGNVTTTAPSFSTQPSSQTVTAGSSVTFTAAASGTPPPTYQWQKDGANISGATSSSYSINSVSSGDAGNYTVIANNSAGNATSNTAALTVNAANSAPSFTTQPASQTVTAGSSVTFSAAASGTPTPTYQWQKGGANIPGATGASYSIASVAAGDAGNYAVVASNVAGTATSNAAVLTVNAANSAPSFTTQPASQTVTAGSSVTFSAAASGTPTPTYQWQKGGINISGATSSSFSINSVSSGDAGNYAVVASNSAGNATSNTAALTVNAANSAPSFTTQPASQTVAPGSSVTFTVAASGTPTPTYQWQKGGINISGATSASYSIASVATGDAGSYTVVASNVAGTATSNAAALTVSAANSAPNFTTQPASKTVALGGSVTFSSAASGNPTPTYQWQKDGTNITGATSASYSIASVAAGDAGNYSVVATNSVGSTPSSIAALTVTTSAPTQVLSATVSNNHSATFSAGHVSGSIQWQVSTNSGTSWANLSNDGTYNGVTTTMLTVANATSGLNGAQYRYVLTSGGVVSTSNAASLTVVAPFFPFPDGIAVDASGNLYISDANANTVQKVNTSGQVSLLAGTNGTAGSADGAGSAARFNQPAGLTLLASGAIVVADAANATLRTIGADGTVTTLAGQADVRGSADGTGTAATFSQPLDVAHDANGALYVADSMNDVIRKVTSAGMVTTFAGSAGATGVTDGNGGAARFNLPSAVVVDGSGNVFVSDTTNNTIRKITPNGDVSAFAGLAGVSGSDDGTGIHALFNHPGGLALDGTGNLFLADTGNSTIRKITPAGQVTTFAGAPGVAGLEDGTGTNALFNQPKYLTIDTAGNLYVADTGNASIRKVTPDGVVTTLTFSAAPSGGGGMGGGSGGGGSGGGGTPMPPPPSQGGGGGGGAPSLWFPLALSVLYALRRRRLARAA